MIESTGARHGTPAFMIRRPRGRDLQAIHHLCDSTYDPMVSRLGVPAWPQRANYPQLIHSGTLWVLQSGDRLVAMIRLETNWHFLYLELVTVSPEHQGRGYGRALIEFAASEARKRRRSRLELMTHEHMVDAIGFYLHLGFAETRRYRLYDHTFVHMTKSVAPHPT
jgi:GNAT superfamily N-acetyltransferase